MSSKRHMMVTTKKKKAASPAAGVDLTDCDREPIHVPGSTQARGTLIACDEDWIITHVSSNAHEFLPAKRASDLLGTSLKDAIGVPLFRKIEGGLTHRQAEGTVPYRIFAAKLKASKKGRLNIAAHIHDGHHIVELEPAGPESLAAPLDLARMILSRLQLTRTLRDLCDETASELRELLAVDRVMIYRFLQDGTGQVIAEARRFDLEPLLNLRYPASDVPAQARALYTKNWVRLISDVAAAPVPLVALRGTPDNDRPLDLSYADLRSVSPIHIEYLKNMGVGASMSISIIVGGELWGLIACHHTAARFVSANIRAAAELVGQVFSLQIQTVESIEAYVTLRAGRLLLDRVISEFPVEGELIENLAARLDQLAAFLPSDGVGILVDGDYRGAGAVQPSTVAEATALANMVGRESMMKRGVYATHHLVADLPEAVSWAAAAAGEVCGVLAVPLSHDSPGNWLFFFRRAVAQTIDWGGNPNKDAMTTDADGRISPRKSFAVWTDEVRGQSLPWSSRERLIGDTLRVYLLDIIVRFSDVIRDERRQADQRQRLLANELNHRVRGTLELIQSLVVHGYEEPHQVRQFVRVLEGRIKAIALAHDATSVVAGGGAEVGTLIERALALHSPSRPSAIEIKGPPVKLDAKAYTVLALVIHELVSGAATEQGALRAEAGRLTISWFIDPSARLVLLWDEQRSNGRAVVEEDALGLAIVKRNIPHALGGEADFRVHEKGVKASFVIPARCVVGVGDSAVVPLVDDGGAPLAASKRPQLSTPSRPLDGYSILVVEDQMLSAVDLERLLLERGAVSVRIAGTADAAIASIAVDAPDVAILDLDLGDGTSLAVADTLTKLAIPFLLAASATDRRLIPPQYMEVPVLAKPYAADTVVELLKDVMLTRLIRAVLTQLV